MNKKQVHVETAPRSNDEQKAFDFLMMHYNRVVTLDEISSKAIDRAGQTGKAIRDLLNAIQLFSRTRNGVK